jgi:hypothetical protein
MMWIGVDVVESLFDKCHLMGEWYDATWPSGGIPRGTPPFVGCGKIVWNPLESNP